MSFYIDRHPGFVCAASFADAAAALAELPKHRPHLVLANQHLPGVQGPRLLETLQTLVPDCTSLFFSTYEDSIQLFKATPGGAAGYLLKRTPPDRVLEPMLGTMGRGLRLRKRISLGVREYFQNVLTFLAASDTPHELARLTRREHEILSFLGRGYVDKEIAQALHISVWTVHGHVKKIFEKLAVHTRTEAAVKYLHK